MTRAPPWVIVSGLGTLEREEICDLLAIFKDTGLMNLARDRFIDVARAIGERKKLEDKDTAPQTGTVSAGRKLGGYAEGRRRSDARLKDRTREPKPPQSRK